MLNAAKNNSLSPAGPMALRVLLLLVVALCLGQTRVWGFAVTPQPASGVFAPANPLSIGENYDGWQYDASDSLLAAKATPTSLWSKAEFNGTRVYQRNDLIDAALVDARGRSNLQRMQSGLAPIGRDGKSLNLHHTIQTADGPLAEMTATFHQQNSRVIHINPNTIPSGIDRPAFDAFRRDYWMNRANDFSP